MHWRCGLSRNLPRSVQLSFIAYPFRAIALKIAPYFSCTDALCTSQLLVSTKSHTVLTRALYVPNGYHQEKNRRLCKQLVLTCVPHTRVTLSHKAAPLIKHLCHLSFFTLQYRRFCINARTRASCLLYVRTRSNGLPLRYEFLRTTAAHHIARVNI